MKPEFASLGSKPCFPALLAPHLLFGKDPFTISLPCGQQVIDDSSQLMGGSGDRFGSTETSAHATVVLPPESLAMPPKRR